MNRHMSRPHVPDRLPAPTTAQIASVTDVLEHRWSSNALMVQDRYTQAIERDDHNAASKWALAGAISTDKILVLKGRPTEIVGHLHAHRHDLGSLMDKLANALRPHASVRVTPVTHSALPPTKIVDIPTKIVASDQANDASPGHIDAASDV